MGIFDFLKRNKVKENKKSDEQPKYVVVSDEKEQETILNEEIETFFPENGRWGSNCFRRSSELGFGNLPCHLRDNEWMSQLLEKQLLRKGLSIPAPTIQQFMNKSDRFNELRHNYELEIVRWQINYMKNDGEGWLIPKGYDDFSIMVSPDAVDIFRGGVVRTLTAIGMDPEVVEEGIEKNADMFRERYISSGFSNQFEPVHYHRGSPAPADEEHRQNWLKAKRYEYYCKHKQSVDKYGTPHPDMLMTPEELKMLYDVLPAQNASRRKVIEEWRSNEFSGFYDKLNKKTSTSESQDEGTFSK
ncbi:MAG: hypothetical protein IJW24_04145 [Clostridia bacterium]|nr:hypothetical protein [Clostridia bacterium]